MPRYCRQCGAALIEGAKFCRKCGLVIDGFHSPQAARSASLTPPDHARVEIEGDHQLTSVVTRPLTSQIMKTRRPTTLIAVAALILAVMGVSFILGSSWRSRQQMLNQAPPTHQQPVANPGALGEALVPPAAPAPVSRFEQQQAEKHIRQGQAYSSAGDYRSALLAYHQAQDLNPANHDVYYLMGLAFEKLGEFDSALRAYQQCRSGDYAVVAQQHVKILKKKLRHPK